MKRTLALLLFLIAAGARASVFTLVAGGSLSEFSDPDGLLPFSEADAAGGFTLALTYSDQALDALGDDPHVGLYTNAMQSLALTVGAVSVPLLTSRILLVADDAPGNSGDYIDMWIAQSSTVVASGTAGGTRQATVNLTFLRSEAATPVAPFDSDALALPPWPYGWTTAYIRYYVADYDAEGALVATLASARAGVESLEVTPAAVPLPASIWLLPTAFGMLMARARRRYRVALLPGNA